MTSTQLQASPSTTCPEWCESPDANGWAQLTETGRLIRSHGVGDFPAIPAGAGRQVLEVSGYAEEYIDGTPLKFGVLGRVWAMHWHPWLGTLTQLPSAADQRGRGSQ